MKKPLIVWLLITALVIMSCATYQPRVTPFKLPQAYPNVQQINGTFVAARAWNQEEEARAAFGFNIIKAGLLPVQVVFDNQGTQTLQINPGQTFLVNNYNELFPVLEDQIAYDRVSQATDFPEAVRGFTKGALLGGAAGALIGAAVGVVAGREAGEYAMRGAVAGAASGAVLGAGAGGSSELGRTITEDLYNRTLSNNPIKPQEVAQGIILFPAEAGRPEILRLQLKEKETEKTYNLNLIL
ncbi:MAG: hypothetical protein JRI57_02535 [Deltaproteobacteria bacterium]|nr:hypothetical protein [Deltaproteobacteria bacterium]MBW1953070.1 hypothetical protein [Deltaproteobacteria bacterium]MBW1986710.1 hypothetical protein [Deltaproteobacteria bacterium]MBW2134556.1 hypothetical protein [Deltaproteobacteria bacterium]